MHSLQEENNMIMHFKKSEVSSVSLSVVLMRSVRNIFMCAIN